MSFKELSVLVASSLAAAHSQNEKQDDTENKNETTFKMHTYLTQAKLSDSFCYVGIFYFRFIIKPGFLAFFGPGDLGGSQCENPLLTAQDIPSFTKLNVRYTLQQTPLFPYGYDMLFF